MNVSIAFGSHIIFGQNCLLIHLNVGRVAVKCYGGTNDGSIAHLVILNLVIAVSLWQW